MCGIVGVFERTGRPIETATIVAMRDQLRHRGPDDADSWVDGSIALGHRRLSIRDLSEAGRQPFSDPSGRIVVSYNGEIYNDAELRAELQREHGFVFRTSCDTEILPYGYLAWGDGLFARLEGMFAIALWDRERRRLVLARDGVGIKPLFYSASPETVRFGSEIKALLADPRQSRQLCPEGVHRFLSMGYVGPTRTTINGVLQVPPGSIIAFTVDHVEEKRFWQPRRSPDIRSLDEAVEAFMATWPQVVRDQLVSDVPVGVLQSGGIDSTLVSLAANRQTATSTPLFTASFADHAFDEADLAASVGRSIFAPHHRVPVDHPKEGLPQVLRNVVALYDGQVADEASIPLYLLSRAVRGHVTVALSGDGGDEFFAGYPTYMASRVASWIGPLMPRAGWAALGRFGYQRGGMRAGRLPFMTKLRRFALGIADGGAHDAHAYWRSMVPGFLRSELYGPQLRPWDAVDPMVDYRAALDSGAGDLIDRCLQADQRFHLPGGLLLKSDAMTMGHGLELRVPLLDRRIMDLAGRIDASVLMSRTGHGKQVLRAAAERLGAPDEVVRAKKRGFNTPLSSVLRGQLAPLASNCFEENVDRLMPWLQPDAVRRLWREHRDGLVNHDYTLWPILNFSLWLERLESDLSPIAPIETVNRQGLI